MPHLAQALLDEELAPEQRIDTGDDTAVALSMVAIRSVVPKNIAHVPVEKIIEARKKYSDELRGLRIHIQRLSTDLGGNLTGIPNQEIAGEHLELRYEQGIRPALDDLKSSLKSIGLMTVWSVMNATLTAASAGFNIHPYLGAGSAIALGLFPVGIQRRQAREQIKNSPVAYLMHLQEDLQPASLMKQIEKASAASSSRCRWWW